MKDTERIAQLERQVEELAKKLKAFSSFTSIPFDVEKAFKVRLARYFPPLPESVAVALANAPFTAITAPTGGTTIDAEGRAATNEIITRLEDSGLIAPN